MSENANKKDYGWIGMILLLLLMVWEIASLLPFNIYINILITIVAVILIIVLFIGVGVGLVYAVAMGMAGRKQATQDSWDYWEKMKVHKWEELSEDEQEKLICARRVINGDCGVIQSDEEMLSYLKTRLPIYEPKFGLKHSFISHDIHNVEPSNLTEKQNKGPAD